MNKRLIRISKYLGDKGLYKEAHQMQKIAMFESEEEVEGLDTATVEDLGKTKKEAQDALEKYIKYLEAIAKAIPEGIVLTDGRSKDKGYRLPEGPEIMEAQRSGHTVNIRKSLQDAFNSAQRFFQQNDMLLYRYMRVLKRGADDMSEKVKQFLFGPGHGAEGSLRKVSEMLGMTLEEVMDSDIGQWMYLVAKDKLGLQYKMDKAYDDGMSSGRGSGPEFRTLTIDEQDAVLEKLLSGVVEEGNTPGFRELAEPEDLISATTGRGQIPRWPS